MIEAYAFLAMFTVQILATSVLQAWLVGRARAEAAIFPADRFAQRYPGIDHKKILERYVSRFRVANAATAVLGVLLLGWMYRYTQRPDWDDGPLEALLGVYFMIQASPLLVAAALDFKYQHLLEQLLEGKRTANLKRRGLFDFVSPFAVFLAVLSYVLFVAYVFYIARHPFPGFAGPLVNIAGVTLVYAMMSFGIYMLLHKKNVHPNVSHAARMHATGVGVRVLLCMCIATGINMSLNFTLVRLDLQRWEPFALSAFFVFSTLLIFAVASAPPRRPETDDHRAEQPT